MKKKNLKYKKNKLEVEYNDCSFLDICKRFIKEDNMIFEKNVEMDNFDYIFITTYIKKVLISGKFNINDITDFINFKYAMTNCYSYCSLDKKRFNIFEKVFDNDLDCISFIKRSQSLLDKFF